MNEQRTARPAGAGSRRRSPLFTRQQAPEPPVLTPAEEEIANALTNVVDERVEEGLQVLEQQATILMREVATELWRSSAKDVRPEQERIVSLLSRDQAIRSLIASSDERFQALSTRAGRVEDALGESSRFEAGVSQEGRAAGGRRYTRTVYPAADGADRDGERQPVPRCDDGIHVLPARFAFSARVGASSR